MLRIGEFARLGKVSIKLLRHYDDVGLLHPHRVDRDTGYRYYRVGQLALLNRLLVYRSLGFSLKEMRKLLGVADSVDALREMLASRRTALTAHIEGERARLAEIEARIAQIEREGHVPGYDVAIRSVESMIAVSLRHRCSSYEDVAELLQTLRARMPARADITGSGAIWHRCSGDIDCEALVLLGRTARRGAMEVIRVPGCTVASVIHDEHIDDARPLYRAAITHAQSLGYRIAGPMREMYARDRTGDSSIEVQFPVEYARAPLGSATTGT